MKSLWVKSYVMKNDNYSSYYMFISYLTNLTNHPETVWCSSFQALSSHETPVQFSSSTSFNNLFSSRSSLAASSCQDDDIPWRWGSEMLKKSNVYFKYNTEAI